MNRVKFNPFSEILDADFNQQAAYVEDALSLFLKDFLTEDKAAVIGLNVNAQAVANMTIYVVPGRIYQAGKQGQLIINSNPPLGITAAHPTYDRIDRVCTRYAEIEDKPETRNTMIDTVSRQVVQKTVMTRIAATVEFMVVSGTAAPTPVAPSVPEGWTSLAKVSVKKNVKNIVQADIIDERPTLSAYLAHQHKGEGDGARLDYRNLQNAPEWVIDASTQPNSQIIGGIWLDTSTTNQSPQAAKMAVSYAEPEQSAVWGDLNNITKSGDAVEGDDLAVEIEVQNQEPADKTKLWGLLNP